MEHRGTETTTVPAAGRRARRRGVAHRAGRERPKPSRDCRWNLAKVWRRLAGVLRARRCAGRILTASALQQLTAEACFRRRLLIYLSKSTRINLVTTNESSGTERISSNALLNLLEVGPDPVIRQKVAKRHKIPPALAARSEVLATVNGTAHRSTERISSNRLLDLLGVGDDPVTRQKVAKR